MSKEPFVEAILTVADVLRDMVREEVRAAIRPEIVQPQLEPQEGPWRVEGGDVRSTLTNDDLSYWIEEPKIEALTLAALLNAGAAAEKRVKELEAERKQPHGICAEPPYQRRLREERDEAQRKLRELAGLACAAVVDDYQGDVDPLVDWLQAHTELWGGFHGAHYEDRGGRELYVWRIEGIEGPPWGTFYAGDNGDLKRLTSLPMRDTPEEAQADLDALAQVKGYVSLETDDPVEQEDKR